jgi:hypothetical protein
MGGADSEALYFDTMLLEELRIWNGPKKNGSEGEGRKGLCYLAVDVQLG